MSTSIKLDRVYEIKWTHRAEARLSSLERPPLFADMHKPRKGFYAMCAFIWAAIVERGHRFVDPEEVAEFLVTEEQIATAVDAVGAMIEEAFPPDPEKKSGPSANKNATTEPAAGPSQ